nr:complement resistance protein TraT [Methyloceanibacter methanicus]
MATLVLGAVGSAIGGAIFPGSVLGTALTGATIGGAVGSIAGSLVDKALLAPLAASSGETRVAEARACPMYRWARPLRACRCRASMGARACRAISSGPHASTRW